MATLECCLKVETDTGHLRTLCFHGSTRLIYSTNNPLSLSLVRLPLPFTLLLFAIPPDITLSAREHPAG